MPKQRAFDVLVLGAGASGCAAARALALKYPNASVGLVEQGTRRSPPLAMRVPLLTPFIGSLRSTRGFLRTYCGVTESCLGGRQLTYVKGCGLGGSTLCNDMKYLRGTAADYAAWGNPLWSFEQLLPFFTATERNSRGVSAFHSEGGPLEVTDAPRVNINSELNIRWFESCEALGVPETNDFNAGKADGFSSFQSHVAKGVRADFFDALLEENRHMLPNLAVIPGRVARRIVFDGRQAVGVETCDGCDIEVLATQNVIVCLGSLESPALLWRSGVAAGGVVVDLPDVGQNLIQSCCTTIVFGVSRNANLHSKSVSWRNFAHLLRQWREYNEERTGVFASFAEAGAFVRSTPAVEWPDLSLTFFSTPNVRWCGWMPFDGFAVRVAHHYPQSRGEVTMDACSGGSNTLRITSRMLSTRHDVQCMDEGVRWVGSLFNTKTNAGGGHRMPFSSLEAYPYHPASGLRTQRETAAFLAQHAESTGDLFGTCALGRVVDSTLCVLGVEGVHVADASVVPVPTCGSSSVIGTAIGTRVASFVRI